jgi:hypothetical protein
MQALGEQSEQNVSHEAQDPNYIESGDPDADTLGLAPENPSRQERDHCAAREKLGSPHLGIRGLIEEHARTFAP